MKIPFNRIAKGSVYPQKIENSRFSVEANFSFQSKHSMLLCHLHMVGKLKTNCNSCGDDIVEDIDEELDFLINNGIFNGFDDEFDVVETLDGLVNLEDILLSELELIASNYFHCDRCDGEFEKEF